MMVWRLLLLIGAAGLVTSTGYLVLVMIASARFRRDVARIRRSTARVSARHAAQARLRHGAWSRKST